jgi:hypothetical protein
MRKEFYIKATSGSEGNYEEYIYRKSHWQAITVQTDMQVACSAPFSRVNALKKMGSRSFFYFQYSRP